jgi:hypothetical protein|tara:strand:+ start:8971 stop:9390 length:420 start_codon:yes stop_codon:yes gene_type:complete
MGTKIEILLDFDGTCTTHDFPNIGKDIGSVPVLKRLVENGHKIILFTMRSDRLFFMVNGKSRNTLSEAVEWFKKNEIPLYGINTNPTQKEWTDSPKAYGQLIIDDIGLGTPLMYNTKLSQKPFVDWGKTEEWLENNGLI